MRLRMRTHLVVHVDVDAELAHLGAHALRVQLRGGARDARLLDAPLLT